jgi:hypothetical protein
MGEREKKQGKGGESVDAGEAGGGANNLREAKMRQRQRERKEGGLAAVEGEKGGAQQIEGDEMVMQVDADGNANDAEADEARGKLKQKIRNTERAIFMGAEKALLKQLGAVAEEKDEKKQEKIVDAIKDPMKEKIVEFAKGKALQSAKVKGGGAAGKAIKNKLASEGSAMVGKAAGAVAVVGAVKDVFDAVEEAEIADFKASTFQGLIRELDGALPSLFDGYHRRVEKMGAQEAIDAATGETTEPWITSAHVASELETLFGAMQIQASIENGRGGPLKGGAVFDAVQKQLHPTEEK